MLETILTHLHNWFPARGGKHVGTFEIVSGEPRVPFLREGQYYRVRGSAMNDGLHRAAVPPSASDDALAEDGVSAHEAGASDENETENADSFGGRDEVFEGEIWALAVPEAVIALAEEIAAWREKNPETDKVSESFGGYSYSRGSGNAGQTGGAGGWQAAFAARLAPYRRPYDD